MNKPMERGGMSARPRVMMVLNRYHPMVGGAERQCERLCQELTSQVQWAGVLTHRYAHSLPPHATVAGVSVWRLGRPGTPPLSFYAELARQLWRRASEYDLIHCHTAGFTGLWLALLGRLLGKPVLLKLTARGELAQQLQSSQADTRGLARLKGALRRRIARWALGSATLHLVALTPAGAQEGRQAGLSHVHVIPNGIDTVRYQRRVAAKPAGLQPPVFGYAGRITAEKGTHTLAEAFRLVLAEGVPVQLSIVGSGEHQRASSLPLLQALQQQYTAQVKMHGPVEDTTEFLQGLDFYVSASTYEGMPNAVLEALACGLPCVLSDIDAHRELGRINPEAHIEYFAPDDIAACAAAIRRHAGLHPRPRSILAPALHMNTVAQQYRALYHTMLGTRAHPKARA